MDSAFIQQVLLPIVYVVVGGALIWALVEAILFMRSTRKTVDALEAEIRPVISDVKEMTASLKPAVDKVDPLVERVSLAVDAANLEIMRLDGILENVDSLTGSASNAASAVETVANTPMRLVSSAADKLRGAFSSKKASDASVALGAASEDAQGAAALASSSVASDARDVSAEASFGDACEGREGSGASEGAVSAAPSDEAASAGAVAQPDNSSVGYFTYSK